MPNSDCLNRLRALLATPDLAELGPGPRTGVQPEVELNEAVRRAFHSAQVAVNDQDLARALILLWHDHLEPAHVIAQGVDGADGAFVHGVMHRREPDYGNAKYWFRRVGQHPAFPELAKRASAVPSAASCKTVLARLVKGNDWGPFAMVDACEQAARQGPTSELSSFLRQVQKVETEVLLTYLAGE